VLADLSTLGVDGLLCLGDLVGYGADPGRVVDALARRGAVAVAGNHDHASAGLLDLEWFNPYARAAAEWTAEKLDAAQSGYLAGLPLITEHAGATLVHSSPRNPSEWSYLISPADGAAVFPAFTTAVCFIGHSHLPAAWTLREDGTLGFERGAVYLTIRPGERYVVNVGSVGQPRDGDPAAAYALWDAEAGTIQVRRVSYDVAEARRRIHAAGLPKVLGDRLLHGR
jgi:diadenosine tetraphosphatase ApaH/serine/threonine PP2A family protein phosphatase